MGAPEWALLVLGVGFIVWAVIERDKDRWLTRMYLLAGLGTVLVAITQNMWWYFLIAEVPVFIAAMTIPLDSERFRRFQRRRRRAAKQRAYERRKLAKQRRPD